jgi:hypothetical protein
MEESLNWFNGIHGMTMRPCSLSQKENDKVIHSSQYSVKENFLQEYQNHISAMQIVAECAKVFILKNWKKVKNWSELNVVIEDGRDEKIKPTEYYNYIPNNNNRKHGDELGTIGRIVDMIEEKNAKKHNPVLSVSKVVLDPTDGDFSITINDNEHWWISDDSVIVIAAYVEEQLKKQKNKIL